LNRPLSLFEYEIMKQNPFLYNQAEQEKKKNEDEPTYITVSVQLEPLLQLPGENEYDYYPGAEKPSLLIAGSTWVKELKNRKVCSTRVVKAFGENINGQSVFLSRYLTRQKPPREAVDLEQDPQDPFAIEKVARFVQLIPFIEDNRAFEDLPDLWCTSQEFLDLGGGDYEEHSILLCNYFNYIDEIQKKSETNYNKSYLILGKGMPEGYTTYVMR
jgi:coiled-coil and C2 domain-containing protein 2A